MTYDLQRNLPTCGYPRGSVLHRRGRTHTIDSLPSATGSKALTSYKREPPSHTASTFRRSHEQKGTADKGIYLWQVATLLSCNALSQDFQAKGEVFWVEAYGTAIGKSLDCAQFV